jgi:hypothetical protein
MAIKDILLPLVGDADAAMVEKCAAVAGEAGRLVRQGPS